MVTVLRFVRQAWHGRKQALLQPPGIVTEALEGWSIEHQIPALQQLIEQLLLAACNLLQECTTTAVRNSTHGQTCSWCCGVGWRVLCACLKTE